MNILSYVLYSGAIFEMNSIYWFNCITVPDDGNAHKTGSNQSLSSFFPRWLGRGNTSGRRGVILMGVFLFSRSL